MAREKHDDIEFGSDSFLDVVANIVGILIILIVVAGIKAGATPVTVERVADYLKKHASPKASESAKSVTPAPAKAVEAETSRSAAAHHHSGVSRAGATSREVASAIGGTGVG